MDTAMNPAVSIRHNTSLKPVDLAVRLVFQRINPSWAYSFPVHLRSRHILIDFIFIQWVNFIIHILLQLVFVVRSLMIALYNATLTPRSFNFLLSSASASTHYCSRGTNASVAFLRAPLIRLKTNESTISQQEIDYKNFVHLVNKDSCWLILNRLTTKWKTAHKLPDTTEYYWSVRNTADYYGVMQNTEEHCGALRNTTETTDTIDTTDTSDTSDKWKEIMIHAVTALSNFLVHKFQPYLTDRNSIAEFFYKDFDMEKYMDGQAKAIAKRHTMTAGNYKREALKYARTYPILLNTFYEIEGNLLEASAILEAIIHECRRGKVATTELDELLGSHIYFQYSPNQTKIISCPQKSPFSQPRYII